MTGDIEGRLRRALEARADLVGPETLRPQPSSDLDELATRRRRRKQWVIPTAIAAGIAAIAATSIAVPQLMASPEDVGPASSASPALLDSTPSPTQPAQAGSVAPPSDGNAEPTASTQSDVDGQRIDAFLGITVIRPDGWTSDDAVAEVKNICLVPPVEKDPNAPSTLCPNGLWISQAGQQKTAESWITASQCTDGSTSKITNVASDTRPAAGKTADYRSYTLTCGTQSRKEQLWFLPKTQVVMHSSGPMAADPVMQEIVESIDISDYSTNGAAQPETFDPNDIAGRTAYQQGKVLDLGFTPVETLIQPDYTLSMVTGHDAAGRYAVFFFVSDRYIGRDSISTSAAITIEQAHSTKATITYQLSDQTTVAVTFSWDGTRLNPDHPIPPTQQENPAGPYR